MQSNFKLYIGTKTTSSWSLRAWLMLKLVSDDFISELIKLDQPDTQKNIRRISPSGRIPLLEHNNQKIWETLAIGEYLAELFPHKNLWPQDLNARTMARCISNEMHAGFRELREHLPFDLTAEIKHSSIPASAAADIERILAIWNECRTQYGVQGKFLFGDFTIADAMFAPVAIRFITYDVKLPKIAEEYVKAIRNWPAMQEWCNK